MKTFVIFLGGLAIGATLVFGSLPQSAAAAEEEGAVIKTALEMRAEALLAIAVKHIEDKGEAGVRDFARQSAFVDRDLYAYAVRTDGVFLASGGSSAALVGDNVIDYADSEGKPFFREMIETARSEGRGRVEYRWFNPADSRGEPKVTLFQRVGDVIVAVGYYPPRATPVEAKAMLRDAVKALAADRAATLAEFQHLGGRFIRNDLYVFVVDLERGLFLAHGATPALVGTDAMQLRDPRGELIVLQMAQIAKDDGAGEYDYFWRNPTTGRIESKHTFFRTHNGMLIGVGSYNR